ncbi:MAG: NAD-dependent epimerase/dehydratase family protein [Candidatus Omnitrophota bacterium]
MHLLLTGGTGYLGGILVRTLSTKYTVRVLVRDRNRAAPLLPRSAHLVEGHLQDRDSLKEALRGCDAVFHLAALVKSWVPDKSLFEKTNVEGFRNLAELSWEQGVQRFVYTSSFLALGPTDTPSKKETFQNPYVASKRKALELARSYQKGGYPLVTAIPTVLYGPGALTEGNHVAQMLKHLLSGKFPGWIDGGKWRWNFAFVADVAEGEQLVFEKGRLGKEYILGGETVSLKDFMTQAAVAAGCPVPKKEIPSPLLLGYAAFQEWMAGLFRLEPSLTRGILETYRHDWVYPDDIARAELGYTTTPLREALTKTVQWLKGSL